MIAFEDLKKYRLIERNDLASTATIVILSEFSGSLNLTSTGFAKMYLDYPSDFVIGIVLEKAYHEKTRDLEVFSAELAQDRSSITPPQFYLARLAEDYVREKLRDFMSEHHYLGLSDFQTCIFSKEDDLGGISLKDEDYKIYFASSKHSVRLITKFLYLQDLMDRYKKSRDLIEKDTLKQTIKGTITQLFPKKGDAVCRLVEKTKGDFVEALETVFSFWL